MDEKRIADCMKRLHIDRAEAVAMLDDDKAVDRMSMREVTADLTEAQKQAVKKSTQADRKPTVYNFTKRERKPNNDKRVLIDLLSKAIPTAENVSVINPEREIEFFYNSKKYKITLSAPRS